MAQTVKEIMNGELFSVAPADTIGSARQGLLGLGISSAPVLGPDGHPIGMVSLQQLVGGRDDEVCLERMAVPASTLRESAPIVDAARVIAERDHVHVVVVDEAGRAVGMVSAVDVLRALIGAPVHHPEAFPHVDPATGVEWSDDAPLDAGHVEDAPDGPGMIVLVHDIPGSPRRPIWAEATADIEVRLLDMLDLPQESAELARWLGHRAALKFRVASVADEAQRHTLLERLQADIRRAAFATHRIARPEDLDPARS